MKSRETGIDRSGIRGIALAFILILVGGVILFASAGDIGWVNAWVYIGLALVYEIVRVIVLAKVNPEVLNERGKLIKKGTKFFDRVFFILYLPFVFAGYAIMGLDAVRYQWTSMNWILSIIGVALFIPSCVIGVWVMAVNPFFECTVRIQEDRNQKVIDSGPYRFIRHPGYLVLILSSLATPFILGSWWGLVPMGAISMGVVIRTFLEDRTLRHELPGYKEYVERTRFRLIPLIW